MGQVPDLDHRIPGFPTHTWQSLQFGGVTRHQAGRLRDSVVQNLDQFLQDWQAVQSEADQPESTETSADSTGPG